MTRKSRRPIEKSEAKTLSLDVALAELNRLEALRSGDIKMSLESLNRERQSRPIEIDFDKIKTSRDAEYAKHQIHEAILSGQISGKGIDHLLGHLRVLASSISSEERAEEDNAIYEKTMIEEIELFPARLAEYKSLDQSDQIAYVVSNPFFRSLLAEHKRKELFKIAKAMKSGLGHDAVSCYENSKSKRPTSKSPKPLDKKPIAAQPETHQIDKSFDDETLPKAASSVHSNTVTSQPDASQSAVGQSTLRMPSEPQLTYPKVTTDSFKFLSNKPIPPLVKCW